MQARPQANPVHERKSPLPDSDRKSPLPASDRKSPLPDSDRKSPLPRPDSGRKSAVPQPDSEKKSIPGRAVSSMNAPARVVRIRRKNNAVVQGCDVYIGRACFKGGWELHQSKWHNPFPVSKYGSVEKVVELFEEYIRNKPELLADLEELRGKVLGCWCKERESDPCHGDVLVKLLREKDEQEQKEASMAS
eukprot:TRINITY_DN4546_c0_g1_i2.p1 TRINITY_DN4546_c0_g1~~TRINITY_DN4546_c0_g1_i2.p1  ORF type:complete len:217 (+),score=45.67 TRINITY_DN4546_c0_g1_i2:80-652(+)